MQETSITIRKGREEWQKIEKIHWRSGRETVLERLTFSRLGIEWFDQPWTWRVWNYHYLSLSSLPYTFLLLSRGGLKKIWFIDLEFFQAMRESITSRIIIQTDPLIFIRFHRFMMRSSLEDLVRCFSSIFDHLMHSFHVARSNVYAFHAYIRAALKFAR